MSRQASCNYFYAGDNMQLHKLDQILLLKTSRNKWLGFHTQNLEVAELSEEHYLALQNPTLYPQHLSDLNEWKQEVKSSSPSPEVKKYISNISLNVTQVCNLHCKYCAAGGDGTYGDPIKKISVEQTLPQLKKLLNSVPQGEKFTIKFIGGEPLLYPQGIHLICEYMQELAAIQNIQLHFAINTNATLIDEITLNLIAQYNMAVTVSLDGPPEINEINRVDKAGKSASEKIFKGLDLLIKNKSRFKSLGLSAVYDRNNLFIEESYHYFKKLNVDWYEFNLSYDENTSEINQTFIQKMTRVAEIAYTENGEDGLRKIKYFNHIFTLLDQQQRVENHCGAGKSFAVIDAKNQIYPCPWMVGNPQEKLGSLLDLNASQLAKYAKPLIDENNCQTCWAKHLCGGGCMYVNSKKTGSKNIVDPEFCLRTQSLISTAIMYYELSRNLSSNERKFT